MKFGVGVSVFALGFRLFSADLATVGHYPGTPSLSVPMTVDLKPTRMTLIGGWAPSPERIQGNRTPSWDSDFAFYRSGIVGGNESYTLVVDSQGTSTLTMPAEPDRSYVVTVVAVDLAVQQSAAASVTTKTPPLPRQGSLPRPLQM